MQEKVSLTVNRSLAFVGAFALAVAQPAVTLAAPPGGLALSRPPGPPRVSALSRPAVPSPHTGARGGSANQDGFKVPFHVDVQPQALMDPQHFTLHSAGFSPQTRVLPYRRYGWQSTPRYLWYPALSGPACSASNNFLDAPSEQQPPDFTIGSLVDGKSSILSPQSYGAGFAAGNDPGAASSSPFTFKAGFYPMACGAPSFTNL